jgi:hypothetical protein
METIRSPKRRFELELHGKKSQKASIKVTEFAFVLLFVLQLLVIANVAPSSLILSTPMMQAICSSETSVLTRARRRHIQEDGILHYMLVSITIEQGPY